jgi:hypothetical protein
MRAERPISHQSEEGNQDLETFFREELGKGTLKLPTMKPSLQNMGPQYKLKVKRAETPVITSLPLVRQ